MTETKTYTKEYVEFLEAQIEALKRFREDVLQREEEQQISDDYENNT